MLVVDASILVDIVTGTPTAATHRDRLRADDEQAAPEIVDVEVFGVIRRRYLFGRLDRTAASLAVEGLHDWSAERFGHRPFLSRAWELRHNVRGWDAFYVALAEALDATLLTTDARLRRAKGPRCEIEVLSAD
ncbi:MAG: type II toxin-antitoxin system VapC family toxin [Geodermatophilaceae bacterium]|nr:type II toxin-antitoxin system VapC family toxin [Geodermatophilaceae bacterium]